MPREQHGPRSWRAARFRIPPFIATLGTQGIAIGVTYHICGGFPIGYLPPGLTEIGNAYLLYIHPASGAWRFFSRPAGIAQTQIKELVRVIPVSFLLIIVLLLALWHLLKNTRFGQHTYAIGGSMDAAVRSGVPVDSHVIRLYMLSAATSGVAGFLSTLRYTAGSAVIGDALLLSSIAAVIIGGVSMFGGAGTVIGTVIGALIIAVLTTGLVMLNVDAFWQFIVVGTVVIVAVLIDQSRDLIIGRQRRGAAQ